MEVSAVIILGIYGLGFLIVIALLIYLVFRRIEIKKKEDFEDREN